MRVLVFTLRPDRTSLWLTREVAKAIGARENARLTQDQYGSRTVQEYLSERLHTKAKPDRMSAPTIEDLTKALERSLELQSHYAWLLNFHDGGGRIGFKTVEAWMDRLRTVGKLGGEPTGPVQMPGVCRDCGCTDERACQPMCWWVDSAHTICSACAYRKERKNSVEILLAEVPPEGGSATRENLERLILAAFDGGALEALMQERQQFGKEFRA